MFLEPRLTFGSAALPLDSSVHNGEGSHDIDSQIPIAIEEAAADDPEALCVRRSPQPRMYAY